MNKETLKNQNTKELSLVEEKTAAKNEKNNVTEEPPKETNSTAEPTGNGNIEKENQLLKEENEALKKELVCCKYNVKEECKDDLMILAQQQAENENCDFLQAAETVLNKYPSFRKNNVTLNLGGSTQGIKGNVNKDAFASGINNTYLGGK